MAEKLKAPTERTWRDLEPGNVITESGNAADRRTGDWRSESPVIDREKCIKCGLCWLHCPDAAIRPADEGYYDVDLYHCKGCGICASICPKDAIHMEEEEEQ